MLRFKCVYNKNVLFVDRESLIVSLIELFRGVRFPSSRYVCGYGVVCLHRFTSVPRYFRREIALNVPIERAELVQATFSLRGFPGQI